ncbi:alcohol dehydrogenase catalytic domain-containing protein [Micromonospora sp. WMMD710]|uniref:alcohol dehydrogenase catalytic domain-containing protein n=1 Tax=Micromonospora sp. WMMD710 TaxID=3016085 RepID=UPI0024176536|nr:alcohol dehydrogenase catalytic domain-containing protein [Micromonospora sp. WMMD710]MDG4761446.1 alcohol dehydrogenase catalytic domain-containing protein [Micromonospora sp. WMMD710]
MKAVVYHGTGDIRVDDVPEPKIEQPTDAVVRVTTAAICGTDLHFIRGTMSEMEPGRILGHEGVGVVEEVGSQVSNFKPGDRVLISAVLGCGSCSYCRRGYFAQCDDINPYGPRSGTASAPTARWTPSGWTRRAPSRGPPPGVRTTPHSRTATSSGTSPPTPTRT